jgi:hypothetical protein
MRGNDRVGYGLVVGLNGTGDALRNSPFTEEIMQNLLERLGVNVAGEQFRAKNVAAVFVTAALPPFARAGGRIDVTVSAIGDATSLLGGTLVMTPLNGADGQIYAVAVKASEAEPVPSLSTFKLHCLVVPSCVTLVVTPVRPAESIAAFSPLATSSIVSPLPAM